MGRNRPSNEDAPRVPGEENSRRRRPLLWLLLGLLLLLLLALLTPFACQALRNTEDQGSGAQGGTQESQGAKPGGGGGTTQGGNTGSAPADNTQGSTQGSPGSAGSTTSAGARQTAKADLAAVKDLKGKGMAVTIPKVTLEGTKGWLVIHADDGGKPGAVLGHAALKQGANENVEVKLDRPISSSQKLYAMVHVDDPANGKYTFPNGDPPATRNGEVAAKPFNYTVGAIDGDLPESGGISPALIVAAGMALLLSGLVCFSFLNRGARRA